MRAILAVYDKEGIQEFAQSLLSMGCEIISTEEAKNQLEDSKPKDLFEKADCEDGYCPLPTQQVS